MHLVDRLRLPAGYRARPYVGEADLPEMLESLRRYREHTGDEEMPTLEQMRNSYAHLTESDPELDIALVSTEDGSPVGYCRASIDDVEGGVRDLVLFAPLHPDHLAAPLFDAIAAGMESHLVARASADLPRRFRGYGVHPGPGREPTGEAAWLEARGYVAGEWGATLRRPHLDDVPDLPLPEGVEVRPVRPEQVRHIWEVHHEAFRGEWDFHEPTAQDIDEMLEDPHQDVSLWQVAWAGDTVVGQVKPFVNHEENEARGYLRGYTEYISTHRDWRRRGIARALLARSLIALRERGMTEAVLGVDTNNPGGAFHVYTSLGFELLRYEAVYFRPVD